MKRIGLQNVTKDEFWLDSWTFERAVLRFQDQHGELHTCQMGAYQTNFETDGFETYDLVYVGRGTASDYEGLNVRGKLVLADINQRDEWWINYPVYQAYLKGAVGLIAVQTQGYAEIDPRALNAQDIAGPEYAPAFSLSRQDASYLKNFSVPKILQYLIRPLSQLNSTPLPGSSAIGRLTTLPDIFRELPLLRRMNG